MNIRVRRNGVAATALAFGLIASPGIAAASVTPVTFGQCQHISGGLGSVLAPGTFGSGPLVKLADGTIHWPAKAQTFITAMGCGQPPK